MERGEGGGGKLPVAASSVTLSVVLCAISFPRPKSCEERETGVLLMRHLTFFFFFFFLFNDRMN